jgi:hypothetical protein
MVTSVLGTIITDRFNTVLFDVQVCSVVTPRQTRNMWSILSPATAKDVQK